MPDVKYRRVLVKVGGEALAGPGGFGIDPDCAEKLARSRSSDCGTWKSKWPSSWAPATSGAVGMAWRMAWSAPTADHMGMLATVMNALALQDALERAGVSTRVQTAIEMRAVAEPYIRLRAIRHLEKGRVVILGAGTGNPYFTTDTAAALRAMEINADVLIKATKVDAVYAAIRS